MKTAWEILLLETGSGISHIFVKPVQVYTAESIYRLMGLISK